MEIMFGFLYFYILILINFGNCSDITHLAFGDYTGGLPAAFGDFNSDELTDVFVLSNGNHKLEILLAYEEEPLLRPSRPDPDLSCSFANHTITSVVPGDFDGDALMDVLVTTKHDRNHHEKEFTYVYIIWGGATYLNCSVESQPIITMIGQPLAIDYNQDMIIDLFGQDIEEKRTFWIFNQTRDKPEERTMKPHNRKPLTKLTMPHAHAFLGKLFLKIFL